MESPLKSVQRHLHEMSSLLCTQLRNATAEANGPNANRTSISRLTDSLLKLKFIEPHIEESLKHLDNVAMDTTFVSNPQFAESLRLQEVGRVEIKDDSGRVCWKQNEERYVNAKMTMNQLIAEAKSSRDFEMKKAEKQVDPPLICSQAKVVSYLNSEISAKVVSAKFDRVYIQIQGDSIAELDDMKNRLESHEMDPVPELDQLVTFPSVFSPLFQLTLFPFFSRTLGKW